MIEFEAEEGQRLETIGMRRYENVFIDVDSCAVEIEGIDMLGMIHGLTDEIAQLTDKAMNGEVAMEEVFGRRLEMIKPDAADLMMVANAYRQTVTPDAKEVIAALQGLGIEVHLLSGGYDGAIVPLATDLGVPRQNVHANRLLFDYEGKYAGFDPQIPLWRKGGKRAVIDQLKKERRIWGLTAIVGDAVSEVETRPTTDLTIGFGGHVRRDAVVQRADVFVNQRSFLPLLPLLMDRVMVDHILLFRPELRDILRRGFDAIEGVSFNRQAEALGRHILETYQTTPLERFDPMIPAIKENDG